MATPQEFIKDFKPLSPNSDRHQISPCNINVQLSEQVSRIKEMITTQLALQQMYGDQTPLCTT